MTATEHRVEGIDHVQLAMPPGPEAEARAEAFFAGLLGLPRVPKPPSWRPGAAAGSSGDRSRCISGWRRTSGRPARPTRPWWCPISTGCAASSTGAGHPTRRAEDVPGQPQWYVDDPFGNRIELIPVMPGPSDAGGGHRS